jgi:hypothetical protein
MGGWIQFVALGGRQLMRDTLLLVTLVTLLVALSAFAWRHPITGLSTGARVQANTMRWLMPVLALYALYVLVARVWF